MKLASIFSGAVFAMYAVVLLLQIWASVMSWTTFFKLTISSAVIIMVVFGLAMLFREYVEEKSMKENDYID